MFIRKVIFKIGYVHLAVPYIMLTKPLNRDIDRLASVCLGGHAIALIQCIYAMFNGGDDLQCFIA